MLTEHELAEFTKRLEEEKVGLEKEISGLEKAPEFGSDVTELEDEEADEAEEWSNQTGMASALKKRIIEIDDMLVKIKAGKASEIPEKYIKAHLSKK
jgi:RNA polymerase-binding transcription factor DksA